MKNFKSEELWSFFQECIMTRRKTIVAGLRKTLGQVILSTLMETDDLKNNTNDSWNTKFLSILLKNSHSDIYIEARNFLVYVSLSPEIVMEEFKNIWGQETFSGKRTTGRGKFSLLYGSEANVDDVER